MTPPAKLDTTIALETPEGTQIELQPAGPAARGLAFLIDELLRWLIILGASSYLFYTGDLGRGLFAIVFFVTYWLYGVLFEVFNNGVTPGKKFNALQVVHDDGTPIRLPASLLRNLVLWVDLLPVFYLAGICSMTCSREFQRLGDLAAGTLVVYRPGKTTARSSARAPLGSHEIIEADAALAYGQPLRAVLTPVEQAVLVDLLERSETLSRERVSELAALVGGVLHLEGDLTSAVKQLATDLRGR